MSPPTLPAELWRDALRLSVSIPGLFETKWNHPPDMVIWDGWKRSFLEEYWEYYSALQTKKSIVLVSRTWREMGMELLYEHLLLFGEEAALFQQITLLTSIFERHSNDPSSPGRALKRLDISPQALTQRNFVALKRLLTSCHSLRILTMSSSRHNHVCQTRNLYGLGSLLQSRFHHSLRRLDLNMKDLNNPHNRFTLEFHVEFPNLPLDSLELGCHVTREDQPPGITTVSSLSMHETFFWARSTQWCFPALRHLSLNMLRDADIHMILPFLTSHGSQLISLHVISVGFLLRTLPQIISRATNLYCLSFEVQNLGFITGTPAFPNITHIGLCLHERPHEGPLVEEPSWTIPNSTFPNLRCIRFLHISDERPDWVVDIARKHSQIRVEDKERRPILSSNLV